MKFDLPRTVGSRALPSLYSICGKAANSDASNIELSGAAVEFIDPQGLAILGALVNSLDDRTISIPWLSRDVLTYMTRMKFFENCVVEGCPIIPISGQPLRHLVELTCISDSTQCDQITNRLADAITGTFMRQVSPTPSEALGKTPYERARHPIWYSLSELLGNALTHARRYNELNARVWVAAQYYETLDQVQIAVVDNGCGILRTLETHSMLKDKTHLSAVRLAIRERVSCNRDGENPSFYDHGNQGVGLTTSMRIAIKAQGGLFITSGDGHLHSHYGNPPAGSRLSNQGFWSGVSLGLYFRRSQVASVDVRSLLPQADLHDVAISFK
jgi:hypothetical protein